MNGTSKPLKILTGTKSKVQDEPRKDGPNRPKSMFVGDKKKPSEFFDAGRSDAGRRSVFVGGGDEVEDVGVKFEDLLSSGATVSVRMGRDGMVPNLGTWSPMPSTPIAHTPDTPKKSAWDLADEYLALATKEVLSQDEQTQMASLEKRLLNFKAEDLLPTGSKGNTLLHKIAQNASHPIVGKILLPLVEKAVACEWMIHVNNAGETFLHEAARTLDSKNFKLALETLSSHRDFESILNRAPANSGHTAFYCALEAKKFENALCIVQNDEVKLEKISGEKDPLTYVKKLMETSERKEELLNLEKQINFWRISRSAAKEKLSAKKSNSSSESDKSS